MTGWAPWEVQVRSRFAAQGHTPAFWAALWPVAPVAEALSPVPDSLVGIAGDGVGGADDSRGTGLRGLADRVEALDGHLRVPSPPGRDTTVVAELPCGS